MVNTGIKILLANPPTETGELVIREGRCEQSGGLWATVWPPLTLATIAGFLEQDGHDVIILDCPVQHIDDQEFLRRIIEFNPSCIILNMSTPTIEHDLGFPQLIKEILPKSVIAAIGTHVSVLADAILEECANLDVVICGEPEMTIRDIAFQISKKGNIETIPGLSLKSAGKIIRTQPRSPIDDLDNLPLPAWHLVDLNLYRLPMYERKFLMISSARGCPFNCSFCTAQTYYGQKLRIRSPKKIVDEMIAIRDKFGIQDFLFWTETFTLNKEQVYRLCNEIKTRAAGMRWTCNSRVDAVDEAILVSMKEAGCWMVSFGIESCDSDVLRQAGKNIDQDMIHRAVRLAQKAGLQVTGHFILGLPGETQRSLQRTIDYAVELDVDYAQFYCAAPFPGSALYLQAQESGWIRNSAWKFFEQTIANMDYPGISADEIQAARSKAIKRFYLRPRMVVKSLKKINNFQEFYNLCRMFGGFIRSFV